MNRLRAVGLLLLLTSSGACGGGCAGTQARQNVLVPTMKAAWPRVRENVDRGLPDAATSSARDAMTAALETADIPRILAVDWPALKACATAGIGNMEKAGEISAGVAGSLLNRLESFQGSIEKLRSGGGQ